MNPKLLLLFFAAAVVTVAAEDTPGEASLTTDYILNAATESKFNTINNILANDNMKFFYNKYYARPIKYQTNQAKKLEKRLEKLLSDRKNYPYPNQISMDPNMVSRLINIVPRKNLVDRISQKEAELATVEKNNALLAKTNKNAYDAIRKNPTNAAIQSALANNEKILYETGLRETPLHTYSTPFGEPGKNMDSILNQIRLMEHAVKKPLQANLPNAEEISALNRLSEKLSEVSKRIHQKPLEDLHQQAHAQDLMLERLANLIRRMSNAVDSTRSDQFLNNLHSMLHRYHLHDEKFLSSLEDEIGYALANGTPLQMPREYAVAGSGTLATPISAPGSTQALNGVTPAMSETESAKQISANMKAYGKTLLDRSHELKRRAEMVTRRNTIAREDNEELLDQIKTRLISPPAQVHAIGAARPAYQYDM